MIFTDLQWKLLSLIAAIVLWFIGMNMTNPDQNQIFTQRLSLNNIDILARDGIMLLNEDDLRAENIQVGIRGLRRDMDILRAAQSDPDSFNEMVEVSVDFRAIEPYDVMSADGIVLLPLRVSPNLYHGFEHWSVSPNYVYVYLDATAIESFAVETDFIGEVAPGFEKQQVRLVNERVTVTGARTDLRTVERISVEVNISGISEDMEQTVVLRVFDADEQEITDRVALNVSETTASVQVWPIHEMRLSVQGAGTLAGGFAVAGITPEPEIIEIVAPEEVLAEIGHTIFVEIDIEGANADVIRRESLLEWLPEGASLARGRSEYVTVEVAIEPIYQRIFSVPRDDVRIRGVTASYQFVGPAVSVPVAVSGARSLINALTPAQIGLELDLRFLPIGTHFVPLSVSLPSGLFLTAGQPTLAVQIQAPAVPNGNEEDNGVIAPPPDPPPDPDPPDTDNGGDPPGEYPGGEPYDPEPDSGDGYEYNGDMDEDVE